MSKLIMPKWANQYNTHDKIQGQCQLKIMKSVLAISFMYGYELGQWSVRDRPSLLSRLSFLFVC